MVRRPIEKNSFTIEFVSLRRLVLDDVYSFVVLFQVIDLPLFDEKHSPRLIDLLCLCQKISSYLLESSSNTAVLHCAVSEPTTLPLLVLIVMPSFDHYRMDATKSHLQRVR